MNHWNLKVGWKTPDTHDQPKVTTVYILSLSYLPPNFVPTAGKKEEKGEKETDKTNPVMVFVIYLYIYIFPPVSNRPGF